MSGSFLLARDDRPTWPIRVIAVAVFVAVMAKCGAALLGGPGVVESGGLWAWVALCAAGALHYERRVGNELRRMVRP